MATLKDVKIGKTVTVKKLNGEGALKRRIMDMGITKGTEIFVRKVAPLGDPIEVMVRGYELTLRKDDAEMVEINGELEDQLDLKNDMLAIEDKATNEFGMVHEKYLNGEYLSEEVEDYLEVYGEDQDGDQKTGLAWLLSAFGIGG